MVIDWDRVTQLQEEVGEDDFDDVVEIFLEEMKGELDALEEDTSDQALEAKMHFLKGAALNLGLAAFADLCQMGEELARQGKADAIELEVVVSVYQASIKEFIDVRGDAAVA